MSKIENYKKPDWLGDESIKKDEQHRLFRIYVSCITFDQDQFVQEKNKPQNTLNGNKLKTECVLAEEGKKTYYRIDVFGYNADISIKCLIERMNALRAWNFVSDIRCLFSKTGKRNFVVFAERNPRKNSSGDTDGNDQETTTHTETFSVPGMIHEPAITLSKTASGTKMKNVLTKLVMSVHKTYSEMQQLSAEYKIDISTQDVYLIAITGLFGSLSVRKLYLSILKELEDIKSTEFQLYLLDITASARNGWIHLEFSTKPTSAPVTGAPKSTDSGTRFKRLGKRKTRDMEETENKRNEESGTSDEEETEEEGHAKNRTTQQKNKKRRLNKGVGNDIDSSLNNSTYVSQPNNSIPHNIYIPNLLNVRSTGGGYIPNGEVIFTQGTNYSRTNLPNGNIRKHANVSNLSNTNHDVARETSDYNTKEQENFFQGEKHAFNRPDVGFGDPETGLF